MKLGLNENVVKVDDEVVIKPSVKTTAGSAPFVSYMRQDILIMICNIEKFLNFSTNRSTLFGAQIAMQTNANETFKVVRNYGKENGYTNDYYFKHVLYGEYHDDAGRPMQTHLQDTNLANLKTWGGEYGRSRQELKMIEVFM